MSTRRFWRCVLSEMYDNDWTIAESVRAAR